MSQHNQPEPGFQGGAVESDTLGQGPPQILPVWATTEPFGYQGDIADQQLVGGSDVKERAAEDSAARAVIGPEGD